MSANVNNNLGKNTSCRFDQTAKLPVESMNFAAIVKNQQIETEEKGKEKQEFEEALVRTLVCDTNVGNSNLPTEVLAFLKNEEEELIAAEAAAMAGCESDIVIAQMLQAQFDKEYNDDLNRIEKAQNKQSKITVCLDKYRKIYVKDDGDEFENHDKDEHDNLRETQDWDRFDANERLLDAIPKCGYTMNKEGEMITKHDDKLCGVRNACRMMSFPLQFATGDVAGLETTLSNQVFNQLKTHSVKNEKKTPRMDNRKENAAKTEMGVDGRTRLLLNKLINKQILEQINGIISTGKEALILHANSDPNFTRDNPNQPQIMPKECAVKIFKTTLNDVKQRDRYIKDDYRFKNRFNVRFSKQNNKVIKMGPEKEMHNLMRLHNAGIKCPEVVILKSHVLVLSFIGENYIPAPKLKDALLSPAQWIAAYDEVVETMHKMYNIAKLVHAHLSEYNILWHEGTCWIVDVAQAVEPQHPLAWEYLLRDCNNITTFFGKHGVTDCHTKEALFEHITSMNVETVKVAMLEGIHSKGANIQLATAPNQDECPVELQPLEYPFDLAWEKTFASQKNALNQQVVDDSIANAMPLNIQEPIAADNVRPTAAD